MTKPPDILVVDIGGTNVKAMASGSRKEVKIPSGPEMTPALMVAALKTATATWEYEVVSMGYPGPVVHGRPFAEPHNLGPGWVGFDFSRALGCPVKILNDAAMQALGSYRKGRMLFLGLGTGLGSALVVDGVLEPMELAHLPYRKGRSYEDYVGRAGLDRMGRKKWRRHVEKVIGLLQTAVQADEVVLGGGNAHHLKELPAGCRMGDNKNAFLGGFRLWDKLGSGGAQKRFVH
jgi:polyphosphate glucokinase